MEKKIVKSLFSANSLKVFYGRNILENFTKIDLFFMAPYEKFFTNYRKNFKFHKLENIYGHLNFFLLIFHSILQCDIFSGENLYDVTRKLFKYQKKFAFFLRNCDLSDNFSIFSLQKFTIEKKKSEIKNFLYYFPIISTKSIRFEKFFFFFKSFFFYCFFARKKITHEKKKFRTEKIFIIDCESKQI